VNKKFANDNSHCSSVHIVCTITLKPILLDFSGHVLSSNDFESVKKFLQIVFIAKNRKIVYSDFHKMDFSTLCVSGSSKKKLY
jgi:hypothetical protein